MGIKVVTDAATEPVDATFAKLWTKIDGADDDDIIDLLITGARKAAESFCERYFVPRTIALHLDAFPTAEIELPRPPIIAIDHVKYYDGDGVLTTISSANYTFEQSHGDPPVRAWLLPASEYEWPSTQDVANAVEIQYQCGFSTCPWDVKEYICAHIASTYSQRESIARSDRVQKVVPFWIGKLDPYRIVGV